jgi:hypothetical protein
MKLLPSYRVRMTDVEHDAAIAAYHAAVEVGQFSLAVKKFARSYSLNDAVLLSANLNSISEIELSFLVNIDTLESVAVTYSGAKISRSDRIAMERLAHDTRYAVDVAHFEKIGGNLAHFFLMQTENSDDGCFLIYFEDLRWKIFTATPRQLIHRRAHLECGFDDR